MYWSCFCANVLRNIIKTRLTWTNVLLAGILSQWTEIPLQFYSKSVFIPQRPLNPSSCTLTQRFTTLTWCFWSFVLPSWPPWRWRCPVVLFPVSIPSTIYRPGNVRKHCRSVDQCFFKTFQIRTSVNQLLGTSKDFSWPRHNLASPSLCSSASTSRHLRSHHQRHFSDSSVGVTQEVMSSVLL